ncbi:cytochrome b/b6 domain-containing protein [Halomonas llamarensis]|uniref:Cytochrome b/b6 domain-containing protein n=1 Tax=Halomonas llamarensis TaxID=2945104 RepID=A0ABT0SQM4_9GAMM|nr:cytochrome b/b6 domain-containing protein [Halomonas llamarensis]MCL7930132.1 cytochrome b/b6 domain-containing protein [Halomonas llamarensis]
MRHVFVWDIYVRVFHWGLVGAVIMAFYTMETSGAPFLFPIEVHAKAGYTVLGLLAFRWLWGLVGSHYARFHTFLAGPSGSLGYAKATIQRSATSYAGHNPLGGWMVVVMLLSLTFQAVSGLFLSDDIFFQGPLHGLFGGDVSKALFSWHRFNSNLLVVLIGLHLVAIVAHRLMGEKLVKGMVTGVKTLSHPPVDYPASGEVKIRWGWALVAIFVGIAVTLTFWLG